MSKRILFFINPISGTKSKAALEDSITKKCQKEDAWFAIEYTRADGDYGYLGEKIEQDRISDIVICGGDGSISPVVKFITGSSVNVGIIPLGSGNGLARTAGISNKLKSALNTIFTGKAAFVDAFTVNDVFACQICGLGYDASVAHEFARRKKRGLGTYVKLAVGHFFKSKPYRFDITIEEKQLSVDAFMLCVSNANQFGNNLKIAPRASLKDGLLDVIVVKKTVKLKLLWLVARHIFFGKKTNLAMSKSGKKNLLYFNAKNITIHNVEHAPVQIDGDPARAMDSCRIEIIPSAYKLIQP